MLYINSFVKNIGVAEDLMEDTFAKLLFKKSKFKGQSSFKTYLYSIGRNIAFDYLRKNRKHITEYLENTNIADEKELESLFIKSEYRKNVHKCLNNINEEYREVLHLIYFEDLTYNQIEKIMRKNNKQIKNLAYRARLALKNELEKEGFVYEEV